MAICEPSGSNEPFCLLPAGSLYGDFEIFKYMPCLYFVKSSGSFELVDDKESEVNLCYLSSEKTSHREDFESDKCKVLCLDADTLRDLLEVYQ